MVLGTPKKEPEALVGYGGPPFLVDVKRHTILIPGDGSQKAVFTDMRDIGTFVALSLDLPHWEPDSRIVGDRLSFNEIAQLAEKITGHIFQKTYISKAEIESILAGNPNAMELFFNQFISLILEGGINFESTVNAKFPDIRPITAESYLTKYWSQA